MLFLADDMGLGKTLTMLSLILAARERTGRNYHILVFCAKFDIARRYRCL